VEDNDLVLDVAKDEENKEEDPATQEVGITTLSLT